MKGLIVRLVILSVILYACVGCATLTEDEQFEREYARGQLREQHALCKAAVASVGKPWLVIYNGGRTKATRLMPVHMRADLHTNNCYPFLRSRGYDL